MEPTTTVDHRTRTERPGRMVLDRMTARLGGDPAGRWIVVFAAVGVVMRLVRFLTDRPLWGDEAMVAVNVLGRGYAELLGPLDFFQVAPAGFLWIERAAVDLLGASEWSLRLVPAACGIAALLLFARLARRSLGGVAAMLAVAVLAVSYAPVRHAVEVKPYAIDLLAAVVLMGPALEWLRRPVRSGPLWLLVAMAPMAMACSHPSAFVAGGIGLAMTPTVWRGGRDRPELGLRRAWAIYLLVVPLAFAGLYAVSTGDQSAAVGTSYRHGYWAHEFPPMGRPFRLIGWLIATHAGAGFGYPIGGERGASIVSATLAAVGMVALLRRGRGAMVAVLLAPLGLTLMAAMLGRYPYGGSARTMQHAAPSICLLIGVGASAAIGRVADPLRRRRMLRLAMVTLCLIGATLLVLDLVRPYRTVEDQRTRDFARWFWPEVAREAEVGCARAMRGTTFEGPYWRLGRLELYLSHRALYLPPGLDPSRPRLDRVTEEHPLRCVVYNDDPGEDPALGAWLADLGRRYRLRDVRSYTVNGGIRDGGIPREERFLVYEFVPRTDAAGSGRGREPRPAVGSTGRMIPDSRFRIPIGVTRFVDMRTEELAFRRKLGKLVLARQDGLWPPSVHSTRNRVTPIRTG